MKRTEKVPAILFVLLTFVFLVGCSSEQNVDLLSTPAPAKPTAAASSTSAPAIASPTALAPTAAVAVTASETIITPSPVSSGSIKKTTVTNVVVVVPDASIYGGPGEEYPVVAAAFDGMNFPVIGVSTDGLWWRLTCSEDASVKLGECWISADRSISIPTESKSNNLEIAPYIELTFEFLRAIQSGLTASGSEKYLSRDLQMIVEDGRPLPSLFGIRDTFPSFVMTDFSDPLELGTARIRIRFNFDSLSYAVVTLIREDDGWRIDKVAAHNLVKFFGTGELMKAEAVIDSFYNSLEGDDPEAAFDLLSPEAQEIMTLQSLATIANGLEKLKVSTFQPVRGSADLIVYYVRLLALPETAGTAVKSPAWQRGENARWITLVQDKGIWQIVQIIRSPFLTEIESWQRVNVLPINVTLDIPMDWTRASLDWAWSPNTLGIPNIGVKWADLGDFGGDESLLPRYRRELSTEPVDLGWAQGKQYNFELMGGVGETPMAAESHIIVQTGRRAYDFYATAAGTEELDDMQPILQRMVAAVAITDPAASAFNAVETSVNFLASMMRDATGASSLSFISEELRRSIADQSPLESLLGFDTMFHSFNARWLENPAAGQAQVGVTLVFADSTEEMVFTVERDADDLWLVTAIEPFDR